MTYSLEWREYLLSCGHAIFVHLISVVLLSFCLFVVLLLHIFLGIFLAFALLVLNNLSHIYCRQEAVTQHHQREACCLCQYSTWFDFNFLITYFLEIFLHYECSAQEHVIAFFSIIYFPKWKFLFCLNNIITSLGRSRYTCINFCWMLNTKYSHF